MLNDSSSTTRAAFDGFELAREISTTTGPVWGRQPPPSPNALFALQHALVGTRC